jgi:hypothetical protein
MSQRLGVLAALVLLLVHYQSYVAADTDLGSFTLSSSYAIQTLNVKVCISSCSNFFQNLIFIY